MMGLSYIFKSKTQELQQPIQASNTRVVLGLRMSATTENDSYNKVDIIKNSKECEFKLKYEYWKEQTFAMSVNNYENEYFKEIVLQGEDYLPFIYKDLEDGCTLLIHALELILKDNIPYKGYVSLKLARKLWLKTLKKQIGG